MISRASNSGLTVLVRFSCIAPACQAIYRATTADAHKSGETAKQKKQKQKRDKLFPASFYGEGNVLAISNFHSNAISANLLNRQQSCRNKMI